VVISYPRKRNRLPDYDYSAPGWYYITTCTNKLKCWFGEIKNREMKLNKAGEVVKSRWQWLAKHYEYISLDEFAVMPNHVHGILIINKHVNVNRRDNPRIVPTNKVVHLPCI
jgi:REP element-mobilizing transposase RayT